MAAVTPFIAPSGYALRVTVPANATLTITNVAGGTLYYGVSPAVSSSSNDGNLTATQSATFTQDQFVISASTTNASYTTARPSTTAVTQTYATATHTHAADTASDMVTTGVTQSSPYGFAAAAQGDAIATKFNLLRADVDNAKQVLNGVIDDLQAQGFLN